MNKNDIIETNNNMVDDFLEHHGIKGMKWGVRRYQNPDGSLTPEGQARYNRFVNDVKQHGGKAGAINSVKRSASIKETGVGIASMAAMFGSVGLAMGAVASAPTFAAALPGFLIAPVGMLGTAAVSSIASTIITNNANKKIADIKDIKEIADQYVDKPTTETSNNKNVIEVTDDVDSYLDRIDKNGHYRWDDDGNIFYWKDKSDIATEKAGNSKLDNITNDQYESLDRDLFEYGGHQYAKLSLKTRQKLIQDLNESRKDGFADPLEFDIFDASARTSSNRTQDRMEEFKAYKALHPNSELTFNEFNAWSWGD